MGLYAPGTIGNLDLEVDKRRGVLYLHSRDTGRTVLRVCRIPKDIVEELPTRRSPLWIDPERETGKVFICTEDSEIIVGFTKVPLSIFKGLEAGSADITYGYHPVGIVVGGR